jgi:hypothetical protein
MSIEENQSGTSKCERGKNTLKNSSQVSRFQDDGIALLS